MGVFVILAVSQVFHQRCRRITQMQRHRKVSCLSYLSQRICYTHIGRIALGAGGQIYSSLGQRNTSLGPSYLHYGVKRGIGHQKSIGIGQAHILGGRYHQTACNECGILTSLHHTCQPVKGCIGITSAYGFDEGRYDIIVHLTVLIVCKRVLLQTLIHDFIGYYNLIGTFGLNHQLKDVEQFAGIASRETQDGCSLLEFYVTLLEQDIGLNGTVQKLEQVFFLK